MNPVLELTNEAASLTANDRCLIAEEVNSFPGRWSVEFEQGDEGDCVFARLRGPWSDDHSSAFLLERRGERIVLTDRLANAWADHVTIHRTVAAAMDRVWSVVLGD
jgi:hypothetical protein